MSIENKYINKKPVYLKIILGCNSLKLQFSTYNTCLSGDAFTRDDISQSKYVASSTSHRQPVKNPACVISHTDLT